MGGSDDPSNLIELTIEEHAEAHRILWEQYGNWQDNVAWKALSGQITNYEATILASINYNTGRKDNEETRLKKSLSRLGKPSNQKGNKWTSEQKENLKKIRSVTKYVRTPEENKQISERQKKLYEITCPDGKVIVVRGLVEFCKENNLNRGTMCLLANGKKKKVDNHKGFKIKFI
jgi:hypothetical protein